MPHENIKCYCLLIRQVFLVAVSHAQSVNNVQAIKKKLYAISMEGGVISSAIDTGKSREYMHTIAPNGKWPDIDHKNGSVAKWLTIDHLKRLLILAIAYRSQHDQSQPLPKNTLSYY